MANEIMNQFKKRLQKEGMLKALICGLVAGAVALLLSTFLFWFFGYKAIWLAFVIFAAVIVITTLLCYFLRFAPTDKYVAQRLDALGLKERLITMQELEGVETFMARKQREDALRALKAVNKKSLKFALSFSLVIALAVLAVPTFGATGVYSAYVAGAMNSGMGYIEKAQEVEPAVYEINYTIQGSGAIVREDGYYMEKVIVDQTDFGGLTGFSADDLEEAYGDGANEEGDTDYKVEKLNQMVKENEEAMTVTAVANPNYIFITWSDGVRSPIRTDMNLTEDMTLAAIFAKVDGFEMTDWDTSTESEPSDENNDKGDDSKDDGRPGSENEDNQSPNDNGDGNDTNTSGSMQSQAANQVINGGTYYGGSTFDTAYGDAVDGVNGNSNISDGEGNIVGGYFDGIDKG